MGVLCKLFGHRPEEGYYRDDSDGNCYGYFKIGLLDYNAPNDCVHAPKYNKREDCQFLKLA